MNNAPNSEKVRRRWSQFSLRALLALILLAAFCAWWLKSKVDAAWREERALAALAEFDGFSVYYSRKRLFNRGSDGDAGQPHDHPWLRSMFGDAFVDEPIGLFVPPTVFHKEHSHWIPDLPSLELIHVSSGHREHRLVEPGQVAVVAALENLTHFYCAQPVNDADLAALGSLHKLEVLEIGWGPYSKSGMDSLTRNLPRLEELTIVSGNFAQGSLHGLARLSSLKKLDLAYCRFADQDFSSLCETPLRELVLSHADISDDALIQIGQVRLLKKLKLDWCQVGDQGVSSLANLISLEYLDLSQTQVADEGIRALGKLDQLQQLHLFGCTGVTGTGLASLAALDALRYLDLRGTSITDDSLIALRELASLEELNLDRTNITDAGIAHLSNMNLSILRLPNGITPACVPDLSRMKSLAVLYLPQGFSMAAVEKLQANLPRCSVQY